MGVDIRRVPRTVEKRYKLVPSPVGAQGEGNGGEATNGIQSEEHIIVLCLASALRWCWRAVDQHTLSSSMSTAMG